MFFAALENFEETYQSAFYLDLYKIPHAYNFITDLFIQQVEVLQVQRNYNIQT
jgi:hypothetical protein